MVCSKRERRFHEETCLTLETKMSAAIVRAHGGSKDIVSAQKGEGLVLGGIVRKTTTGVDMPVHMRSLDRLISQTTGTPKKEPLMEGVIASTIPAHMKAVPEYHKVPERERSKTVSKMSVGGTYSGPKSGYGMAKKH